MGARAVDNLILQLVARAERRVEGVLAAELVRPTLPAWRRAKERATVELWIAGEVPAEIQAFVSSNAAADAPTALLIDDAQAVVVMGSGDVAAGLWTSHPAIIGLVRAMLRGRG